MIIKSISRHQNPKTSRMILHSKGGNHHICQEAVDPLTDGGGDRKLCQLFLKGDGVKSGAEVQKQDLCFVKGIVPPKIVFMLLVYCIASLVSVCACLAICCDKQESVFNRQQKTV